jgi:hypothetical protein
MKKRIRLLIGAGFLGAFGLCGNAAADGIVSRIVSSPLSPTGTVRDANVGINIWLQSGKAQGGAFFNPDVVGYGIPAGGRVEIEMLEGYERVPAVAMTQKVMMVVTGTPQQGMPGKVIGYKVSEGTNKNTIAVIATRPEALQAEKLVSPAPGGKNDPVRQRGIKVFHVGLLESPFINRGKRGVIEVRIIDGSGTVVSKGRGSVDFLTSPIPQIQPTNFPDKQRSHNWQSVAAGETLGKSPGTVPISVMFYQSAKGVAPEKMVKFKAGETGVGVLSTQQLAAMKYEKPGELARYTGGLILKDVNGDGRLDPKGDLIIGGVMGKAPAGATGQELRSLDVHGAIDLSKPTTAYHPKFGKVFGGAIALMQFTAGNKPGLYQPTLALLRDPSDRSSGDGSSYTFTIVVE